MTRGTRLFVALAALVWAAPAAAQTVIPRSVIAGGATNASSPAFGIQATVGQPAVGTASGAGGQVLQGYWTGPVAPTTGAGDAALPASWSAIHVAPHPVRGRAHVSFMLANDGHVRLRLYDVRGAEVATLLDRWMPAGSHRHAWEPRLAHGVYFYRLTAGRGERTGRIVLAR